MNESLPDLSTAPMLVAITATFTVEPVAEQLKDALEKGRVRTKTRANSDGNESTPSVQNGSDKSSTALAAAKVAAMLSVLQSSII
jgi:hypothetical protein